jgi:hypothetical protein
MASEEAIAINPKLMWSVLTVLGLAGVGGGGSAVASWVQASDAAETQPEIQRSLERMDREMMDLRDRDKILGDRLEASEDKAQRRHERVMRDLDDIDRDLVDVTRIIQDLCRSDRKCRRRQNLDDDD